MTNEELKTQLDAAEAAEKVGDYEEAKQLAEKVLDNLFLHEESLDEVLRARAYRTLGQVARMRSVYPLALEYYGSALDASKFINDREEIAEAMTGYGNVYLNLSENAKAFEYYEEALKINEELHKKVGIAKNYDNIGITYRNLSEYIPALEYHGKAIIINKELDNKQGIANNLTNAGIVYRKLSDDYEALKLLHKTLAINEKQDAGVMYWKLSDNIMGQELLHKALELLHEALAINESLRNKDGRARSLGNIGIVYQKLTNYDKALEYFQKSLALNEELDRKVGIAINTGNIGAIYAKIDFYRYDFAIAEEKLLNAKTLCERMKAKQHLPDIHKSLAELYGNEKRYAVALSHFKEFYKIEKEVQSEEAKQQASLMEQRRKEVEREKQLALEQAEREKQAAVERARHEATQQLLHNTLPPQIADRLLAGEYIADAHNEVSVIFADIVDFTRLSQRLTPKDLVESLNSLFSAFDDLAEKHNLEKIKTIGDCYMAIAGAPIPRPDHAQAIAHMAIEMMETAATFRAIATGETIQLRIGLHLGEVVAGVIGRRKYTYDIWGDAVNTASRMESHGEAGKIHCSEAFVEKLGITNQNSEGENPYFKSISRGEINIKGKGMMNTYFLEKA